MFNGCLRKVSRMFQGSFKDVSRKIEGCSERHFRVDSTYLKEVPRACQGSLKLVSKMF